MYLLCIAPPIFRESNRKNVQNRHPETAPIPSATSIYTYILTYTEMLRERIYIYIYMYLLCIAPPIFRARRRKSVRIRRLGRAPNPFAT